MNDLIELVEYWNRLVPLHEVMLASEYEKKKKGEPYETLASDDQIRVEFMDNDITWASEQFWRTEEEFEKIKKRLS